MSKVTTTKLTVQDIAERLGVHPATAQMMLDPRVGIIEGECLQEGWGCVEKAFTSYLKKRKPRTPQDIWEATQRAITSCITALHGLEELDLLIAERDVPPENMEAAEYFKPQVHKLIDMVTNVIELGNEAVQEAQKRMPKKH